MQRQEALWFSQLGFKYATNVSYLTLHCRFARRVQLAKCFRLCADCVVKLHGNSKQAKSECIYTQASSPKIQHFRLGLH